MSQCCQLIIAYLVYKDLKEIDSFLAAGLTSLVQDIKDSIIYRCKDYDWPTKYGLPDINWE